RSRRDVGGHVCDVYPRAQPVALCAEGERVVEVLRGLRVDREGDELAEVDAALDARLGRIVRLERSAQPALNEQALEHRLDPVGRPEHLLQAGTAAAGADDGEVAP